MGDRLKSAYELAMERLEAAGGASEARPLSDEQRARIAAIRKEFEARRAEAAVLHESAVGQALAANDAERVLKLEDEHRREKSRLEAEEEEQVRQVRES